jgi:hypothetical protein
LARAALGATLRVVTEAALCTCGVIAVGRCVTCGDAFCQSHGGGDMCRACWQATQVCYVCGSPASKLCGGCAQLTCDSHVREVVLWLHDDSKRSSITGDPVLTRMCSACHEAREKSIADAAAHEPGPRIERALAALKAAGYPGREELYGVAYKRPSLFASKRQYLGEGYRLGFQHVPGFENPQSVTVGLLVNGQRFVDLQKLDGKSVPNLIYDTGLAFALEELAGRVGVKLVIRG